MTDRAEFLAKGELVGIRPISPEDNHLRYAVWHDGEVQRNLNFVDNDSFEVWLEKAAKWRSWLDCVVISLADGLSAGYVSLGSIEADTELLILLLPEYRGRGLGTEAARLIIDYGFATLGISRVGGGACDFNTASQNMLGKLGFVRDPDQDESADNVWGEGKVTELCYHLDRETWQRTRNWQDKARPAVFDARPALETIKQLDIIRVCGSEGEARAMDVIADGLSALGVAWRYHTFEDWWVETVDPHLELRGRKLPVRPVLEPAFMRGSDSMGDDGPTVDVCCALAPMGKCYGLIAVAECFDRESPVARDAAAQLMAFEFDPEFESYLRAQDWDVERVPAAYLRVEDVALVRDALGEQAALRWGLRRVQRQFRNLTAEVPGTGKPEECVVMGAHVDSFPGTVGASDDAAGCAILLEAAKWFAAHPPARTVRLAWFTGEEVDRRGSRAYVRDCIEDPSSVKLIVNVDCGGCEMYTGGFTVCTSDESTIEWARRRLDLHGMEHSITNGGGTDARSFIERGMPAILVEAPSKQGAHLPDDSPENIDPHKLQFLGSISLEAAIHAADDEVKT